MFCGSCFPFTRIRQVEAGEALENELHEEHRHGESERSASAHSTEHSPDTDQRSVRPDIIG
jgi:hypothetical protein